MVSVCMATYNGSNFIHGQLFSILGQLEPDDEVIISDDCSKDDTIAIIEAFNDSRIKIIKGPCKRSPIANFENAIRYSSGEFIFLSDQDDVWLEGKVKYCLEILRYNDIVVTDCNIIDDSNQIVSESFFKIRNSGTGFWKNLFKNSYLGCCMAFRADILPMLTPFPSKIPMHDIWIGFVGEVFYKPVFTKRVLSQYRIHQNSVTNSAELKSNLGFIQQFSARFFLIWQLPGLLFKFMQTRIGVK